MSNFERVALITGSAQGIGRSIALRLARDGFDIALNDLESKRDQMLAIANDIEKMGRRAYLVPADVSIEGEVKQMVQDVAEKLGGLDVIVANAGIASSSFLVSTEMEEWERLMSVNLRGTFLCYKHAAAQMITQGRGGRIIGASSVLGKAAYPLFSSYCASKFAVRGLTQTAAHELGRYKITVNAYAPGLIETPMTMPLLGSLDDVPAEEKELVESFVKDARHGPIKHDGQPEDIASIVSYLASKEAHFITGE